MKFSVQCRLVAHHLMAWTAACFASPWAWYHEQIIVSRGRSLTDEELQVCACLGVCRADAIRIMRVDHIPNPLRKYAHCFSDWFIGRLISDISGITLGRGIYIRVLHADSISLIAHELVHVRQYQQAGSIWGFMREYIYQCLDRGYYDAPWEIEARSASASAIK